MSQEATCPMPWSYAVQCLALKFDVIAGFPVLIFSLHRDLVGIHKAFIKPPRKTPDFSHGDKRGVPIGVELGAA